jgi:uncharacterized Rmd1/YagE family protein
MFTVLSKQIAQGITIKGVKASLSYTLCFSDSDELFYKIDEQQYLYVYQFGIVSFFNVSKEKVDAIIQDIKPQSKGTVRDSLDENISVSVQERTLAVTFNSVIIPSFQEEMIRLILMHTSQSVALDRYEEISEALLEETNFHTKYLEQKGRLKISSKKLKKFIGRTLNIKNGIYENLYIFDSPEVTWENEQLARLDELLKTTFDLKPRFRNIQDRIDIIKENLDLFKDIWDHKESSTLEWIIILLIVIEVIDMFVTKIFA